MNYLYAFLLCGTVCAIGQIILDNTKLTPGHITASFTAIGALLSFLGIYDFLISNFGHMLYSSAYQGYLEEGVLGIFSGMFVKSSAAITAVIVFSFIFACVFKPKD